MARSDPHRLDGQVALVTGASSGIGRASAIALAQAGAAVAINHLERSAEAAENLRRGIEEDGGRAVTAAADVSVEEEVEAMFEAVEAELGVPDILLANAGIQDGSRFTDMTLVQWNRVITVNLTGQFLCARAAIRGFLRRGALPERSKALGKVICMSSVHQTIPWAFQANYAAAKGGVMLLMQSLAQEFAKAGIRVNAIAPGAIETSINRDAWSDDERRADLLKLIPYGRIGMPEDVADAVVWLASDASDYVNGTTLVIDGGMTLYPSFRGRG
jgi:glucose 1-dehydrogenase